MSFIDKKFVIGPRKISTGSKGYPIIRLPKQFVFLKGKHVYVTLEIFEPPKTESGVEA